jgi:hypothetical protein
VSVEIDQLRAVVAGHPPDARMTPYLAKVRERAWQITDADVQALKDAGATEDEIFEQTVATAISEGLRRLDAAQRVVG